MPMKYLQSWHANCLAIHNCPSLYWDDWQSIKDSKVKEWENFC